MRAVYFGEWFKHWSYSKLLVEKRALATLEFGRKTKVGKVFEKMWCKMQLRMVLVQLHCNSVMLLKAL